jgi:hypothetical protein
MNLFILCILFFISSLTYSQDIYLYKDTVNNFSIGIPVGWGYGSSKDYPTIKLIAYRIATDSIDKPKESFNINIFNSSNSNFENAYSDFVSSINKAKGFKIIDSSSINLNGIQYKWLIENHENQLAPLSMCNYVFITFKDKKCYILTMVTVADSFNSYKPLFDKIAYSLHL